MSIAGHLRALVREARSRATRWILAQRIRARHPTMHCDPTAVWDYAYSHIDSIVLGRDVAIGPFAEILVYRTSPFSSVPGKLVMEDRSSISTGVSIRAAGGEIRIGAGSGIGQHVVLVAANHAIKPGMPRFQTPWDETRCGVTIGPNVWVGALCVLLPGSSVGEGAVVAAGSVVTGHVPPYELWGGVPARKIKDIER
jgi:acetyltransferase-like isoleucine patch superfamily enzyme